ncbi:MAG: hypothetical protein AAGA55_02745 [Planctomycetota bacterium]
MSDAPHNGHNGSFSHAFLPGLILGLVIGAVAGAFLPDWMGGSKIPAPDAEVDPSVPATRDGEAVPTDEQIQEIVDDAMEAGGEAADDATEAAEDAIPSAPTGDG